MGMGGRLKKGALRFLVNFNESFLQKFGLHTFFCKIWNFKISGALMLFH
jgi:hypothetical protein